LLPQRSCVCYAFCFVCSDLIYRVPGVDLIGGIAVYGVKMAEDVVEIENALNVVVNTTEQSSNMRKTLKEKIYQTVSTLRHLFSKITISGEKNRVR